MTRAREILVGVDGSPESDAAVVWAAHEAAARGFGLALVHVNSIGSYGLWSTSRYVRDELRAMGQPIVDAALHAAQAAQPGIAVRGRVLLGTAARIMVILSREAPLVVVGLRGRGTMSRLLVGSVCQRLMAHAHSPVVAVARTSELSGPRRVVVGMGDPENAAAEQFALQSAREHGVPMLGVNVVAHEDDLEARREELAKRVSDGWRQFVDVDAEYLALTGDPVEVLPAMCHPDDLLVVGHHRHAHYLPATLGPVLSGLVHHAPCAVAVVPEPVGPGEPKS